MPSFFCRLHLEPKILKDSDYFVPFSFGLSILESDLKKKAVITIKTRKWS